jgi:enoyl-CoA hydratase/carnithine racemase
MEGDVFAMEYKTLKYEVKDRILTITLNRPEKLNSYTPQMAADINVALEAANNDDNIRVVIFTGATNTKIPAFCAGSDLSEGNPFNFSEIDFYTMRDTGGTNALSLYKMRKPVIAAINGAAVGIGATLPLSMDIRVMSESAKMGFVFVRRGFVNEACSSWYLTKIVGFAKAMEWVLSGRLIKADEAYRCGLVNDVVPAERVYERALEIAVEIRDNAAPVSVALCRQMIYQMAGTRHPMTSHKIESACYYHIGQLSDAEEGANSFLEKRPPAFKNSVVTEMPDVYPWFDEPEFPKNIQSV